MPQNPAAMRFQQVHIGQAIRVANNKNRLQKRLSSGGAEIRALDERFEADAIFEISFTAGMLSGRLAT